MLSGPPVRTCFDIISEFGCVRSDSSVLVSSCFLSRSPIAAFVRPAWILPCPHPAEALRAASSHLREFQKLLGPSLPRPETLSNSPRPVQVEELMAIVLALPRPMCLLLPNSLASVFGPATLGVPFQDPELERIPQGHHSGKFQFMWRSGDNTLPPSWRSSDSSVKNLEAIWPSVVKAASHSDEVLHHGILLLHGRRHKLPPDAMLSEILFDTEAVLKASF